MNRTVLESRLNVLVRDEAPADVMAREGLIDAAFGEARYAKASERLREGRRPARGLALAAEQDGDMVGTLRLWHVEAGSAGAGLLLGPLVVAEHARGEGVGARLMREALWRAARFGHRFVLLVGDAPYYARFGFQPAPAGLTMPRPVDQARFLAFEILPGALSGARGAVVPTGERDQQRAFPTDLSVAA